MSNNFLPSWLNHGGGADTLAGKTKRSFGSVRWWFTSDQSHFYLHLSLTVLILAAEKCLKWKCGDFNSMTCPLVPVAEMNVLIMSSRTCDACGVWRDFCPRRRFAACVCAAAASPTELSPINRGEIGIGIRGRMFGWYPAFLSLPPEEKVEGGRVCVCVLWWPGIFSSSPLHPD